MNYLLFELLSTTPQINFSTQHSNDHQVTNLNFARKTSFSNPLRCRVNKIANIYTYNSKIYDLAIVYISEECIALNLSKAYLTKLFSIATPEAHCLFNGKVYNQTDYVAYYGLSIRSCSCSSFHRTSRKFMAQ